ncbi:MAG: NifB/NifX family molybdenum-iron cluster-binding protein [Lachnospiraceae bacterium]|nr:NifB/NifX family molybdenum-iron cluster-binding protein [Lachnospiraceae bacterium]
MARPGKQRFVCRMPGCLHFAPADRQENPIEILLSIEEYEVIRLMDYEGKTQQEAAGQMCVSRTTIQALYTEARKKIARFLVEGTCLKLGGGSYELCSKASSCQSKPVKKGEKKMKIAVTYENGQVFQHFGHTEQFKVYEVEDGKILSSEIIDTNGQGHGALAGFLLGGGISILICGGIGGGARNALAEAGIELYPGASGNADAQVESFLQGKLQYDPNTTCTHHHGSDHTCATHTCH